MQVENLYMSEAEKQERLMEKQEFQYRTNLNFLKTHRGFRNSNIHCWLGTSGSGKSTAMRTITDDFIQNNPAENLGIWLSEETVEDLKDEMARLDHGAYESLMSSIKVTSEMVGMPRGNLRALQENFRSFIYDHNLSFLIWDNPTTSALYDHLAPHEQVKMQGWLKELCIAAGIPFLFFLHTKDGVYDNQPKLIELSDVRGSKGLTNLAQYFYISQRFELGDVYFPTLRIRKYRGYTLEDRLFYLNYNRASSTFDRDWALPWDEFMEAFKRRNRLQ